MLQTQRVSRTRSSRLIRCVSRFQSTRLFRPAGRLCLSVSRVSKFPRGREATRGKPRPALRGSTHVSCTCTTRRFLQYESRKRASETGIKSTPERKTAAMTAARVGPDRGRRRELVLARVERERDPRMHAQRGFCGPPH